MKQRHLIIGVLLIAVAAVASASMVLAQPQGPAPSPGPVPFLDKWLSSGHADASAEAFVHWNSENQVPADCAKCHSTPGYLDFMGQNGTAYRLVDQPAPIGTTVQCMACHNDAARMLNKVVFPSGAEKSGTGPSSRCMECHQGRASTVQVNQAITRANLAESPDTSSPNLRFVNVHYFAAAATLFGSEAQGGYQYENRSYQPKFQHVEGYGSCINCHDPHSLQIKVTECAGCHTGVSSTEDLKKIRMQGSKMDYDGDGNTTEGTYAEIQGLQQTLLKGIQEYGKQVAGKAIAYSSAAYPYFFGDTNGNGTADPEEAKSANGYNAFTPRLLKAAYNYQYSLKDPGAYAHNAKYVIQLLQDSIASLNEKLAQPVSLAKAWRNDAGHFDATGEPFRHWDAEGEVPASCAKCHTAEGLPFFLKNNVTAATEPSDALMCATCHRGGTDFRLRPVSEVTFPSGAKLSFADDASSNLCLQCHQGRESTVSVDKAIEQAGVGANQVSTKLSFRNVHYFAAGATLFGTQAKGAYEYAGKQYKGRFAHVSSFDSCVECHDAHGLSVKADKCSTCHTSVKSQADLHGIRFGSVDYDGDGDSSEGIAGEIETLQKKLLAAIQSYATNTAGASIAYSSTSHPYWFTDANGNGEAEADETTAAGRYAKWTPTLLRATYNYQYAKKDPGAFAHNGKYVLQLLYDSLQSVGGNQAVAGMTRP